MGRRSEELKALIEKEREKEKRSGKTLGFSTERAIIRKIKRVEKAEAAKQWPVEDVDYWILRQEKLVPCPPDYVHRASTRSLITKSVMKQVFENLKTGLIKPRKSDSFYSQVWLVYLGPKPDKKWGPRCP